MAQKTSLMVCGTMMAICASDVKDLVLVGKHGNGVVVEGVALKAEV